MLSISVRQIEYAVAVLECGGVSAAAKKLNVTQPALSVAISQLEQHLGKPLFLRKKGSAAIVTAFGQDFLSQGRVILSQFKGLLEGEAVELNRTVNLGCFVDLAPLVLAPILKHIKQSYPKVMITPQVGDFDFLKTELEMGRLDFAVTYNLGLNQEFEFQELTQLKPYLLVEANHRLANKEKIKLKDIQEENFVLTDQEHSVNHMISLFHNFEAKMNISHRVTSFEIMRSFVANGLGVGISYTKPKSNVSYDGKPIIMKEILDYTAIEPVIIVRNKYHRPNIQIKNIMDDIAKLIHDLV
ncbi:LysR family transcriptional regulator [Pseudemcibacter aquimaris]|uniref:LysR family transcriptional regulator n=1 Tax=Pseudemcibacter aquimaris TaxID=2857064 RepID=UPI0020111FB5|nr:LysR family transcriptional regulator [Pseudemcibacter aquimaris]MCC3860320.1 LysR family transcriptional regulator [Pseudemcibacter aquimaris]WDU57646.1 LysR family transcriptional regulator [Pseudemcibacter aquimaris]